MVRLIFILNMIATPVLLGGSIFQASLPDDNEIVNFETSNSWWSSKVLSPKLSASINKNNILILSEKTVLTKDDVYLETYEFRKNKDLTPDGYIIHFNNENEVLDNHIEDINILFDSNIKNTSYTVFNYRSTGSSGKGNLSFDNLVIDGIAQVQRVIDEYQIDYASAQYIPHVLLYGQFLGGAVATRVAHYFQTRGISLRLINDSSPSVIADKIMDENKYYFSSLASESLSHSGWAGTTILNDWKSLDQRLITYLERDRSILDDIHDGIPDLPQFDLLSETMRKEKKLHGAYLRTSDLKVEWFNIIDGYYLTDEPLYQNYYKKYLCDTYAQNNDECFCEELCDFFYASFKLSKNEVFSSSKDVDNYTFCFGISLSPISKKIDFSSNAHREFSEKIMEGLTSISKSKEIDSPTIFMGLYAQHKSCKTNVSNKLKFNSSRLIHDDLTIAESLAVSSGVAVVGAVCAYSLYNYVMERN